MSQISLDDGVGSTAPLATVLALNEALVALFARPASVDALLQEALEIVVYHLGASGGAVAFFPPDQPAAEIVAACGVLGGLGDARLPEGEVLAVSAKPSVELLECSACAWAERLAADRGERVLGAASWQTERGEVGLACLVGRCMPDDGWRQAALRSAAGLVAQAIERLRLAGEIEARLAERDRRWSSFYELSVSLTRVFDRDGLLQTIVQRAIELLDARGGALSLVDETTGESVVSVAYLNGRPAPQMLGHRMPAGEGPDGRVIAAEEPMRFGRQHFADDKSASADGTELVCAPLFVGGVCAGALSAGRPGHSGPFTAEDEQTLALLAQQAGALLERVRNRAQAEMLTIHRERTRLARELHDGLAQNLASLLLKAELCRELCPSRPSELADELDALAGGIQSAIRETRVSIFSLHDSASTGERLIDALRLLAVRFERQTGISVHLTAEGDREVQLEPAQQVALMSVTQEALVNVRKHASAHQVSLHLNTSCPKSVELSVHDNGCGFSPGEPTVAARGYGLLNMRTRLEELGGSLRVDSAPGRGATVVAVLPMTGSGAAGRGPHYYPHR